MAGSEKEGFVNSSGGIFKNHNYIIMPVAGVKKENLELFKLLVSTMGFTRIVETDSVTHDSKIAFTSQLCHVIASALVDSAEGGGAGQGKLSPGCRSSGGRRSCPGSGAGSPWAGTYQGADDNGSSPLPRWSSNRCTLGPRAAAAFPGPDAGPGSPWPAREP